MLALTALLATLALAVVSFVNVLIKPEFWSGAFAAPIWLNSGLNWGLSIAPSFLPGVMLTFLGVCISLIAYRVVIHLL